MRAILIDPHTQKVERITLEGETLKALYQTIGCHTVDLVSLGNDPDGGGVDLWLDGEGLLVSDPVFFEMDGLPQSYAGRAVILAHDPEGNSASLPAALTADMVRPLVSFPEPGRVKLQPEMEWRSIEIN